MFLYWCLIYARKMKHSEGTLHVQQDLWSRSSASFSFYNMSLLIFLNSIQIIVKSAEQWHEHCHQARWNIDTGIIIHTFIARLYSSFLICICVKVALCRMRWMVIVFLQLIWLNITRTSFMNSNLTKMEVAFCIVCRGNQVTGT